MTNRPVNRDYNHYKLARAFLCKESSARWNAQHWIEWKLELVLFSPRHISPGGLDPSSLARTAVYRVAGGFRGQAQADHNVMV